jgi:hypothetical protein
MPEIRRQRPLERIHWRIQVQRILWKVGLGCAVIRLPDFEPPARLHACLSPSIEPRSSFICHTVLSTLVPYISLLVFSSLYRSIYLLILFHFPLTIARAHPHASNVTRPMHSCPRFARTCFTFLSSFVSFLRHALVLILLYQKCSTKTSTRN